MTKGTKTQWELSVTRPGFDTMAVFDAVFDTHQEALTALNELLDISLHSDSVYDFTIRKGVRYTDDCDT